jgi:hypothetical protein
LLSSKTVGAGNTGLIELCPTQTAFLIPRSAVSK